LTDIKYISGIYSFPTFSLCGIKVVEDSDPAWFPEAELREVHGIVPHEPTELERSIFCFNMDGTEGMCCPKYGLPEKSLEEEE